MDNRKSTSGQWLTKALFWELRHDKYTPTFTLQEEDRTVNGTVYLSAKKLYLECADPTEYAFATEVIGSWKHWQTMCQSYHLKPHIQEWRDELEVKLKAKAIKAMINTATQDGAKGTAAAKYIAEKGWEKRRAGTPSKAEVEREKKIAAATSSVINEDATRLGLLN